MAQSLCNSTQVSPETVNVSITTTPTGARVWTKTSISGTYVDSGKVTPVVIVAPSYSYLGWKLVKAGYADIEDYAQIGTTNISRSYTMQTAGTISIESIAFSKTEYFTGEMVVCTITVKNTGQATINAIHLMEYNVNGGAMQTPMFDIPTTGGQSRTFTFSMVASAAGPINICAYSLYP